MSNADKRSPSTDALETLGMIHYKKEHRDAIHLAVEPVKAAVSLKVGQKIGVYEGYAYPVGYAYVPNGYIDEQGHVGHKRVVIKAQGIVDPFLPNDVPAGESFWFIMNPRMVQSLRHVWEHPDFPEGK